MSWQNSPERLQSMQKRAKGLESRQFKTDLSGTGLLNITGKSKHRQQQLSPKPNHDVLKFQLSFFCNTPCWRFDGFSTPALMRSDQLTNSRIAKAIQRHFTKKPISEREQSCANPFRN
jgi:hypothetical protein